MRAIWFILKLPLKILMAPVILSLTLFVWICVGIVYVSGLVLGLISMVVALLGVAVLITYSLQNGIILLVIAFLISPYGLPMAAIWLPCAPVVQARRDHTGGSQPAGHRICQAVHQRQSFLCGLHPHRQIAYS